MSINERMVAVTRRIASEGIGKTRKNTHQNYNFRGVDEVMNAFAPLMADAGLYLRPAYSERSVVERQGKTGTLIYVTVKGDFTFTDDAGEAVTVGPIGTGGIVFQEAREEHRRHIGHAHRHTRMAGGRLFHRIGGQKADRIRHFGMARLRQVAHRWSFPIGLL